MADVEKHPAIVERTVHHEGAVDDLAVSAVGVLSAIQKAIEEGTHSVHIFAGTEYNWEGHPRKETSGPAFQVIQTAEHTTVTLGSVTIQPVKPRS